MMLGVLRGGFRWPRAVWLVVLGVTLAIYFGYHGLTGSRGLLAWRDLNAQLKSTQQELDLLRGERTGLAKNVERLRDDSLDADLIDELARRRLSLADPLDVIILLDEEARGR